MIRDMQPDDRAPVMQLVVASGEFDDAGIAHVRDTIDAHFAAPDSAAIWLVATHDDNAVGVAYTVAEPVTQGTWNLLMLWLDDAHHGSGMGRELVQATEQRLRAKAARLLIVETSGTPGFARARQFYERCGFVLEARIAHFFAQDDAKLVYTKSVG